MRSVPREHRKNQFCSPRKEAIARRIPIAIAIGVIKGVLVEIHKGNFLVLKVTLRYHASLKNSSDSFMFQWFHEFSFEIDAPLQKVWEIGINPSHWPKWMELFESCLCDGPLKEGSIIKAKLKSKWVQDAFISIKVKEIRPYEDCTLLMRSLIAIQESFCAARSITPTKTLIISKTLIKSPLVPFAKSLLAKQMEAAKPNIIRLMTEAIVQGDG